MAKDMPTVLRGMKNHGVSDECIEKFKDELEDNEWDYQALMEDIKDPEESMLFDFFREECGDQSIFDILTAIMDKKHQPTELPELLYTPRVVPKTNIFSVNIPQTLDKKQTELEITKTPNIDIFRQSIQQNTIPPLSSISYTNILQDYMFDIDQKHEQNNNDDEKAIIYPILNYTKYKSFGSNTKNEYDDYISMRLSCNKLEFKRNPLNIIVLLHISTSSKVKTAENTILALLKHLNKNDRFGILNAECPAINITQNIDEVGNINIDELKSVINSIKHCDESHINDAVQIEAAYKTGIKLFDNFHDNNFYTNRLIILTDYDYDLNDDNLLALNEKYKIVATFVSLREITKTIYTNYPSNDEFISNIDKYCIFMEFHLKLQCNSNIYKIDEIYGTNQFQQNCVRSNDVIDIQVQVSSYDDIKNGIILIKLKEESTINCNKDKTAEFLINCRDETDEIYINKRFNICFDKNASSNKSCNLFDDDGAIRKAICLINYVKLMREWILSSLKILYLKEFKPYFEEEMKRNGDESMQRDLDCLNILIINSEHNMLSIPSPNTSLLPQKSSEDHGENVILNAGLIVIPDQVLLDSKSQFLEHIDGITKVLAFNYTEFKPPRLSYPYIDFWRNYLFDEEPTYHQIASDISHNTGPTYNYLMENPPNERILPVLEKIVDQLQHPILDSYKNSKTAEIYTTEIIEFFKYQTPKYFKLEIPNYKKTNYIPSNLLKTCIMFKRNTDERNFNPFELFINITDIYHRILYEKIRDNPSDIIPSDITDKNHFASRLNKEDINAFNEIMNDCKDKEKGTFFTSLSMGNDDDEKINKIKDNLRDFQLISLSFMLFVKAFMCETTNNLEKDNHQYKLKKFRVNIDPLYILKNKVITDNDIYFHNDNMPLQIDMVIIPKNINIFNNEQYTNYDLNGKYDNFAIESDIFDEPKDIDGIYKLYGKMVEIYRKVIEHKKNNIYINNKDKNKKLNKRRDSRYCMVIDRNNNTLYLYPPRFYDVYDDENKENEYDDGYSVISSEYNDIRNFYLTSECLIPAKNKIIKSYYGVNDIEFVISAHFHKQKQWHRYPKLRLYQYFNGNRLRFFQYDIISIWRNYFEYDQNGIDTDFINDCKIFDAVLDLKKCDTQFVRWNHAIRRQLN